MLNNKLQFIQKTRPKLKQGDVFYYMIDDKIYCGLLYLTQSDVGYVGIGNIVVLPNYSIESLNRFSIDTMIEKIQNSELIAPPTNINQRAWTMGYFKNFEHIDVLKITKLEDYRLLHGSSLYDKFYHKIRGYYDEINMSDIPDIKFLGKMGLFAYEGIEYIIQLGLGLEYDPNINPYKFYVEDETIQQMFSEQDLPYWYFNSIGKPLVKPK